MKRLIHLLPVLFLCVACNASAQVRHYVPKVVKEYPHDDKAYTQGLFFQDGQLYESTGLYGSSSFRKVDLASGKAIESFKINGKYFAEGSVILGRNLYILTWESNVAFIYDAATLKFKTSYTYPREGWGLTTDGRQLIASDGSSRLFFMDAEFQPKRTVNVTLNGRPVKYLNELEYIDGRIWANVYTTDQIMVINPRTGEVEAVVDCTGLLPSSLRTEDTDVLNGIAVNDGKIYLTGKNWPELYEIKLVKE